jgi:hypothetical protein
LRLWVDPAKVLVELLVETADYCLLNQVEHAQGVSLAENSHEADGNLVEDT